MGDATPPAFLKYPPWSARLYANALHLGSLRHAAATAWTGPGLKHKFELLLLLLLLLEGQL